MDGVVRTRTGYTGGTTIDPYYEKIGDHSEAIEMDYDPTVVSFEQLLDIFWSCHDPTYPDYSQRVKPRIYYHDEEQKMVALESKRQLELKLGKKIFTEIVPATEFYLAELNYQKYMLQQVPELVTDLMPVILNSEGSMTNSTALARINGYIGGNGTMEKLAQQLNSLGLSEKGKKKLLEITTRRGMAPACPVNL
jgi:peptide-methionine (S)-S-oxide reductase